MDRVLSKTHNGTLWHMRCVNDKVVARGLLAVARGPPFPTRSSAAEVSAV